jgi:2,3,4,5-tetrahydropyridine-2-carboxylate N-succinyltransferase
VGERVHLSAAAQIGGVLEPAGARPVVVEDDCFIGALCGLFEGVVVRSRAVLAAGTILTASTTLYDLVEGRELRGEVPQGAVVVPGSRPARSAEERGAGARGGYAESMGISLYAPCIVKYRDGKTDAATALEEALR